MIEGLTPVPSNSSGSSPQRKILGKDDFLQLLVAQLKAQDPLSPLDGQEFAAQLAQFSSLEQLTNVNANLLKLQEFNLALANSSALNLIGKRIDVPGNTLQFDGEIGQTLSYSLAGSAAAVSIEIFDSSEALVRTLPLGEQSAGSQQAFWDGTNESGDPVVAGEYTFKVTAVDSESNLIQVETFSTGLVTDVLFDGEESIAVVNGNEFPVKDISRVSINL